MEIKEQLYKYNLKITVRMIKIKSYYSISFRYQMNHEINMIRNLDKDRNNIFKFSGIYVMITPSLI
jgi:hypothetical protein